jgi:actin-like ATPase involved in cell morphogenesis
MSYQLGIDLGTTYTAASVSRATERSASGAEVVTLGARSATVASVMYLADDGSILVGEAAERRALTDPDRVVREFKRRIGDEIPLMIAGRPYPAHELGARMIRWVVDLVSEREGGPPRRIAVTHPASWGSYKKDLLGRALRDVGLTVTFLAEPQAAAVSYASAERVDPGSTVAVYDLGGGTFDAAVVRKTGTGGFELLGQPEGIERLGGVDFDEVIFGHVRDSLGEALDNLDPEDPDVLSAVARLRRECVEAKEALSSDTEATIPVLLPDLRTQTRLVRSEFEAMIRPALEDTIVALRRAVGSAGLTPDDLNAVLLVGGSSRIPLVSQLVSDELGRPVAVDADPKTAIAMGAALAISPQPVTARPAAQGNGAPQVRPPGPGVAAGAAGAAGLAGAAGAAAASRQGAPSANPAPPRPGGGSGGGSGGQGTPPPSPPVAPRRPAAAPPPRPEHRVEPPAAFTNQPLYGGDHDGYYAEPAKRKQTGLMIGIGGVLMIAAILAVVFLWPSSSNDSSTTGNSSELTPAETATPETKAPTTHRTTPRETTRQAPPAGTTRSNAPTTRTNPPTTRSTEPSTTREAPTTTANPGDGGTTSVTPGAGGAGGANGANQNPPGGTGGAAGQGGGSAPTSGQATGPAQTTPPVSATQPQQPQQPQSAGTHQAEQSRTGAASPTTADARQWAQAPTPPSTSRPVAQPDTGLGQVVPPSVNAAQPT